MKYRTKRENFFLILMLGALNTITPFSIDMYLPGFPAIAADLHTTIGNVALSVSTYFLGFAAGQLMYGPLLDRFGRKRPLYAGLSLYIIASFCCIAFHSIEGLLFFRFCAGAYRLCGSGGCYGNGARFFSGARKCQNYFLAGADTGCFAFAGTYGG